MTQVVRPTQRGGVVLGSLGEWAEASLMTDQVVRPTQRGGVVLERMSHWLSMAAHKLWTCGVSDGPCARAGGVSGIHVVVVIMRHGC
jgi:hypothetical protein